MRERTWTVVVCLVVVTSLTACGRSSEPVTEDCGAGGAGRCERLDDACFSDGRTIGLEHAGDDCALSLGPDSTGAWEQVLEGCDDGDTAWQDLTIDADVPDGASVRVQYRLMEDVLVPVGLPWSTVDGGVLDLGDRPGRFLDVRVELRAAPGGESPVLRGISAGRRCAP